MKDRLRASRLFVALLLVVFWVSVVMVVGGAVDKAFAGYMADNFKTGPEVGDCVSFALTTGNDRLGMVCEMYSIPNGVGLPAAGGDSVAQTAIGNRRASGSTAYNECGGNAWSTNVEMGPQTSGAGWGTIPSGYAVLVQTNTAAACNGLFLSTEMAFRTGSEGNRTDSCVRGSGFVPQQTVGWTCPSVGLAVNWHSAAANGVADEMDLNRWMGTFVDEAAAAAVIWPYLTQVPEQSCAVMGIDYEYRKAGVGQSWTPVAPGASWPALSFGDQIKWSIGVTQADSGIDHLAFVFIGETPIQNTGVPPNWNPYQLEPFALDLLDPAFTSNPDWMSGVELGIVQWVIRPGYAETQATTVPRTVSGQMSYLGRDGTVPTFRAECKARGLPGVERFDNKGAALTGGQTVLDEPACDAYRAYPWPANDTDLGWGFRLTKPVSTTNFVSLEARYRPAADATPTAWAAVYTAPTPTAEAITVDFVLARATYLIPSGVEFWCTAAAVGGGTLNTVRATDLAVSTNGDLSCYARVTDEMSLTSPKSWVVGVGRLGVCLVEWLVVPSEGYLTAEYDAFQDELEVQTPFSFLFIMDGFLADVDDTVNDMDDGNAPQLPLESFRLGGGDVQIADSFPAQVVGEAADPGDKALLTALLLGFVIWGVLQHAAGLLFSKGPPVATDNLPFAHPRYGS